MSPSRYELVPPRNSVAVVDRFGNIVYNYAKVNSSAAVGPVLDSAFGRLCLVSRLVSLSSLCSFLFNLGRSQPSFAAAFVLASSLPLGEEQGGASGVH